MVVLGLGLVVSFGASFLPQLLVPYNWAIAEFVVVAVVDVGVAVVDVVAVDGVAEGIDWAI